MSPVACFSRFLRGRSAGVLRAGVTPERGTGLQYGYLRLFTFDQNPDPLLKAVMAMLQKMPQHGLILDLRGNTGGRFLRGSGCCNYLRPSA